MRKNLEQLNLNVIPMKWFNQKTLQHSQDQCKSNNNNTNNASCSNVTTLQQIVNSNDLHQYQEQNQQNKFIKNTEMHKTLYEKKNVLCDNNCCNKFSSSIPISSITTTSSSTSSSSLLVLVNYIRNFCKRQCNQYYVILLAFTLIFLSISIYYIWHNNVDIVRKYYLESRKEMYDAIIADENIVVQHNGNIKHSINTSKIHPTISTILKPLNRTANKDMISKADFATYSTTHLTTNAFMKWGEHNVKWKDSTTLMSDEADLSPLKVIRFTSGHQNNFGISIEDDERILKLFNERSHAGLATTVANIGTTIVKVYPTLPQLKPQQQQKQQQQQSKEHIDVKTSPNDEVLMQENGCYSTSLDMCRGVLDYDLTYNSTIQLTSAEIHDYEMLVKSNCSQRSLEFLCIFLEPECRSAYIGVLPPCRRICKAILEDCSLVIANSDTLTAIFDCNIYPDSNDLHQCDDSTRRKNFCYSNEFQCYDHSCIPQQWQCDNIKDCASGEDETQCLICDQMEEFRCKSNDKCIPATYRCDNNDDCFDGSDEEDCNSTETSDNIKFNIENVYNFNTDTFPYSEYLLPNETNNQSLIYTTLIQSIAHTLKDNENKYDVGITTENDNSFQGFVNFHDGKEIMITSDSENQPKFSSANTNNLTRPPLSNAVPITQLISRDLYKNRMSTCLPHQLRCVSGECITVDDLCDKKMDCPDGSDERMCEYKNHKIRTIRTNTTTTPTIKYHNSTLITRLKRNNNANSDFTSSNVNTKPEYE